MSGAKHFRKLQLGLESVAGTPVAATTIWRGMGTIADMVEKKYPEEHVGIFGKTHRHYVARYWGELAMPSVEATFEQLPYLFEAGVAEETPTQDGTGSGYIYQYIAPVTTPNTTATYTIEGGDNQQAEKFDHAFVKRILLSGEGQGALFMQADWLGRQVTNTTYTAALSLPSVEEIIFNSVKLYIDEEAGTIGSTQVTDTLFKAELDYKPGLEEWWAADGSLDFSLTKFADEDIKLKLTYEHNSDAVAEKGKYRDDDVRLMRLLFEGAALGTPGSTYSNKTLQIDMAANYDVFNPLGENNGNDVYEVEATIAYSDVAALKLETIIVNELSALP
jgi:hypothetical protein